jgi:hypothetical protein
MRLRGVDHLPAANEQRAATVVWSEVRLDLPIGPLFCIINGPTRGRPWSADMPLIVIQRQLGHSNVGITSIYLQGIDNSEIIETSTPAERPWCP